MMKVGVILKDVRLTPEESMVLRTELLAHPLLSKSSIIRQAL